MNPLESRLRRTRFRVKNRLGCHDRMIPFLAPHSHWREGEVTPDCELCIEGFPRSANTYAVAAFELAQTRPVKTAHHSHLPGQVKRALRFRVPVLLLVRAPRPALASLLVREPFVSPQVAIGYYRLFHRHLLPLASRCTVADFHEATRDFGGVIERLNREQGLAFRPWDSTPESEAACRDRIDDMDRKDRHDATVSDAHVARPRPGREREKNQWAEILDSPRHRRRMEACDRLYRQILTTRGS